MQLLFTCLLQLVSHNLLEKNSHFFVNGAVNCSIINTYKN